MSAPLDRLRHHVTGAIERGEATAIEGRPAGPAPRGALVRAAQDMRRYRRALSQIANASAGDYMRGESAADYWQRFAREIQRDARRALDGEG